MELRARINAHLRREHREHSVRMVLGRVCIQMSQKKLLMDDKELPFTKAEYEICEFLAIIVLKSFMSLSSDILLLNRIPENCSLQLSPVSR